jgi:murein DD-endopeptidase MepM/ murein hydrolase activator NlpD
LSTLVAISCAMVACSSSSPTADTASSSAAVTTMSPLTSTATSTSPVVDSATSIDTADTVDAPGTILTTAAPIDASSTSEHAPSSTTASPTTAPLPATPYLVPLADPGAAGWGEGHSGYPATDLFASCGAEIVSPVNGTLAEVRTVDSWDPDVDNPATRGGRSVTIIGDDGVRYYLAHFDDVDGGLVVGDRIAAGQRLGTVGLTGRTSGCHVHFGISPPCPGKEWSIRRGAISPKPYLDAWRDGRGASPLGEVLGWANDNPGACELAMNDPFAQDA